MDNIFTFAKLFGSFFYYPLTHANNRDLIGSIINTKRLSDTPLMNFANIAQDESDDEQNQAFLTLFEGCDVMHAPPWGSVYLDKDEVIFGHSTLAYRTFLREQNIELDTGMREPEDQFGLMLWALSQLMEKETENESVKVFLSDHLLTWAYRYLELFKEHATIESYKVLAELTQSWLLAVQEELDVTPVQAKLYR